MTSGEYLTALFFIAPFSPRLCPTPGGQFLSGAVQLDGRSMKIHILRRPAGWRCRVPLDGGESATVPWPHPGSLASDIDQRLAWLAARPGGRRLHRHWHGRASPSERCAGSPTTRLPWPYRDRVAAQWGTGVHGQPARGNLAFFLFGLFVDTWEKPNQKFSADVFVVPERCEAFDATVRLLRARAHDQHPAVGCSAYG